MGKDTPPVPASGDVAKHHVCSEMMTRTFSPLSINRGSRGVSNHSSLFHETGNGNALGSLPMSPGPTQGADGPQSACFSLQGVAGVLDLQKDCHISIFATAKFCARSRQKCLPVWSITRTAVTSP